MIASARTVKGGLDMVFMRLRARVDDETVDLSWRPDPTWNTYAGLVKHICHTARGYLSRVSGLEIEIVTGPDQWSDKDADREHLRRLVDDTHAFADRALESVDEGAWQAPIDLYGRSATRGDVAMFAITHSSEHIGHMKLMDRIRKQHPGA